MKVAGFEDFTADGGIASHLYASAGNYNATLRVTDNDGAQATDAINIEVQVDDQDDWSMFGHDPQHTRRSPFSGPTTLAGHASNALRWSYDTGDHGVVSSPAIGADGTIYVGSNDNHLYAFNPDGTVKWSYTTGLYVYSSPAIGPDGTIYVGAGYNFYAIGPGEGL